MRIKAARNILSLSQDEFGKRFNATQAAVSAWDNGSRYPRYETLVEIADACNVSVDWLLGRTTIKTFLSDEALPETPEPASAPTQPEPSITITQAELTKMIEDTVRRVLAEQAVQIVPLHRD